MSGRAIGGLRSAVFRVGRVVAALAGALLAAPAFAQPSAPPALPGLTADERAQFERGADLFSRRWTSEERIDDLFNNVACSSCHELPLIGGSGKPYNRNVLFGRRGSGAPGNFDPMSFQGGPLLQIFASAGAERDRIPSESDAISMRRVAPLFGLGLVEAIPDEEFERIARNNGGRVVYGSTGRVQRFGSQNQRVSIGSFVRSALRRELGVAPGRLDPEDLSDLTAFVRFLAPPSRGPLNGEVLGGQWLFQQIGCASCHVSRLRTLDGPYTTADGTQVDVEALQGRVIAPYSDFLLHDLGEALSDGVGLDQASAREYRTLPLWGLRFRRGALLHDGRANTLDQAIAYHGGEAEDERDAYFSLGRVELDALRAFMNSL